MSTVTPTAPAPAPAPTAMKSMCDTSNAQMSKPTKTSQYTCASPPTHPSYLSLDIPLVPTQDATPYLLVLWMWTMHCSLDKILWATYFSQDVMAGTVRTIPERDD